MKTLIFGQSGQVATELQRQADVIALGRAEADLSDPAACVAAIRAELPDVVINAAAYTAVDKAEEEEALATVVNGNAPTAMAKICAELDIPFVHISTDYVFDGGGTAAWQSSDATNPLSSYGSSKLVGEHGVQRANGRYAILRTSWVFSAHGNNFVKTMLRLGETRDALSVVADQIGGPTAAADIAAACLQMARQLYAGNGKSGIYHFAGAPDVSWADFAREIFEQADMGVTVADIPSLEYPTPARRPQNSRLDCTNLETVFAISRPNWRTTLTTVLTELKDASL